VGIIISITKDLKNKLVEIAYDIIKDEQLPKPSEVRFLAPLAGTRNRRGTCIHRRIEDKFKIIVYTTIANYVEDPKGKFVNKITKKKMRRLAVGKKLSILEIKKTLAHEIAHLKVWKHDAQHKSYTNYILDKINSVCC